MGDGEPEQFDPAPYLAALPALRAEGLKQRRAALLLAPVVIAAMTALCALLGVLTGTDRLEQLCLWTAGSLLAGWLVIFGTISLLYLIMRRTAWLSRCRLAERLARGELGNDLYYRYLVPAAQRTVRRVPADDHLGQLRRISRFLNWYSLPPVMHTHEALMWVPIAAVYLGAGLAALLVCFAVDYLFFLLAPALLLLQFALIWPAVQFAAGCRAVVVADYLASDLPNHLDARPDFREPVGQLGTIIDELDAQLGHVAFRHVGLGVMLYFSALWLIAPPYSDSGGSAPRAHIAIPVLLLAAAVFGLGWLVYAIVRRRRAARVRDRLRTSTIAARVGAGRLDFNGVHARLPALIRWWHPWPRPPRSARDPIRLSIWEAANNLDWFMDRPRDLMRAEWLAPPALIPLWVIALFALTASFELGSRTAYVVGIICLQLLTVAVVLVISHTVSRAVWRTELIAHLRERLVGDEPAETT